VSLRSSVRSRCRRCYCNTRAIHTILYPQFQSRLQLTIPDRYYYPFGLHLLLSSSSFLAKLLLSYHIIANKKVILYLLITEIRFNFQTVVEERVHVNATSPRGLDVEFDVTLPMVPCSLLNIDSNDNSGQPQSLHLDIHHHIWKHRVKVHDDGSGKKRIEYIGTKQKLEQGSTLLTDAAVQERLAELHKSDRTLHEIVSDEKKQEQVQNGADDSEGEDELCGSCYGAAETDDECCNTCDDVKRSYSRKGWHIGDLSSFKQCKDEASSKDQEGEDEGCNVHGVVALDSGGGSFHIAPGRSKDGGGSDGSAGDLSGSIFEMLLRTFEQWNVTHTVHKIRFGPELPRHTHQLDGVDRTIIDGYGMYQYYFKIVPTLYRFQNGTVIQSNQFSVTEHLRHVNPGSNRGLPGVFFFYEISPLHVEMVEGYRKGYIAFFTSVAAIIGGVVTTMGLLDQVLHSRNHRSGGGGGGGLLR
jgi:endoplasmic reticulum-Golgi intermediate compartment protein 3